MNVEKKSESNYTYHASNPISRSKLFRMIKNGQICPKNYKFLDDNPPEPTDSLVFGQAFHKFVLEPETFENSFAISPLCDRRTVQGKAIWNGFISNSEGKQVITQESFDAIRGMADSIKSDKYAKRLLSGDVETSYYWIDDLTEIECKCRPDVLTKVGGQRFIVDLKSTTNAATDSFARECIKFGYDLQAAMYKQGVDAYYGEEHSFVFIAVEKTAPYTYNILQADEFFIKKGQALFRELMGELKYCRDTGDWYGYGGAKEYGGINDLTLPAYMLKEFE